MNFAIFVTIKRQIHFKILYCNASKIWEDAIVFDFSKSAIVRATLMILVNALADKIYD